MVGENQPNKEFDPEKELQKGSENDSEKKEEVPQGTISSIRTYANDISKLIREGVSLSDVALSEQKKQRKTGIESNTTKKSRERSSRKRLILVIGIILILLGFAVIGGSLFISGRDGEEREIQVPSIIFSNSDKEVSFEGLNKEKTNETIGRERELVNQSLGSVVNIYFTEGLGTEKKIISTKEFLERIEISARGSFVRALDSEFMFGVHSFDGNQGFLVFKVNSFENALSGVFDWEKKMLDDLWPIFYRIKPSVVLEEGLGANTIQKSFDDRVLRNRDTRILKDRGNNTALIYSFPDREHLIITTDENTLIEVFDRLTTNRFRN